MNKKDYIPMVEFTPITNQPIMGVYCIENKINGKKYIGQSWNIYYRWSSHRSELVGGYHSNQHLQNSFDKYGKDSFEFTIIEIISASGLLTEREQYWLDQLPIEQRYNIRPIVDTNLGVKMTEEFKENCSKTTKKRWANMSDEERQYMKGIVSGSCGHFYGKHHTEETKQINREAHIGLMSGENHPFYGKHHTKEAKKKISEAKKGRPSWNKGKIGWNKGIPCTDERKNHISEARRAGIAKRKAEQAGTTPPPP
jgi:group I intron endonuclease